MHCVERTRNNLCDFRSLSLALLALLFSTFALAKPDPDHCAKKLQEFLAGVDGIQLKAVDSRLSPRQIEEMVDVALEVDEMLSPELYRPINLHFTFLREADNASYSPLEHGIVVPYQLVRALTDADGNIVQILRKHPKYSKPVLAHEYGHAYFSRNVVINGESLASKARKLSRSIFEKQEKLKKASEALHQRFKELFPDVKIPSDNQQSAAQDFYQNVLRATENAAKDLQEDLSKEEIEAYKRALNELITKDPVGAKLLEELLNHKGLLIADIERFKARLASPYRELDELFADSVAYFYAKDPGALRKGLYFAGLPTQAQEHAFLRDFDVRAERTYRLLRGNNKIWNSELGKENIDSVAIEKISEYELLNPTRHHLWKHYFSNPEYQKRPAKVLATLLKVLEAQLERNLKDKNYHKRGMKEVNDRLIRRLDEELPKVIE